MAPALALRLPLHVPPATSQLVGAGARTAAGDAIRPRAQVRMAKKVSVRYIPEQEMEQLAYNASLEQGFEESQAMMLAACCRNIYAFGAGYHPTTVTLIEEVCKAQAAKGEPWAVLMIELLAGRMPKLRSEKTAVARSAAAQRKRAAASGGGGGKPPPT
tara:strand:- start:530 stop:1006 length:477 start_codon:yes stop_codon:yes gene_type:complete